MSVATVYAVRDEAGEVVYVGVTSKPVAVRWIGHLFDALRQPSSPFHRWLRVRLDSGHVPPVAALETCSFAVMLEREQAWIDRYQAARLLNIVGTVEARRALPLATRAGNGREWRACDTCGQGAVCHIGGVPCAQHLGGKRHRDAKEKSNAPLDEV